MTSPTAPLWPITTPTGAALFVAAQTRTEANALAARMPEPERAIASPFIHRLRFGPRTARR